MGPRKPVSDKHPSDIWMFPQIVICLVTGAKLWWTCIDKYYGKAARCIYIYIIPKNLPKNLHKNISQKNDSGISWGFLCVKKKVFGVQRSFFSIYEPSKNVWCNRNRENGSCQTPAEGWGAKPPPLMSLGGRLTTSLKKKSMEWSAGHKQIQKKNMEVAPSIFVGFFRVIDVMCCFDSLLISPMVFAAYTLPTEITQKLPFRKILQ